MNILLLCGGRSAEHEVSIRSAGCIYKALHALVGQGRYGSEAQLVVCGITKEGSWFRYQPTELWGEDERDLFALESGDEQVYILSRNGKPVLHTLGDSGEKDLVLDCVVPVLHGPNGEDGTVQGLLELAGVPYVGSGVLGSAVGMDKDVQKTLLRSASIPVTPWRTVHAHSFDEAVAGEILATFGANLFVKPANMGSSVGVSKVVGLDELVAGVRHAFSFDTKVIVEPLVEAREIECAVMGYQKFEAAEHLAEITPTDSHSFYSYESKYTDESGAELAVPAPLPTSLANQLREYAEKACEILCCSGLARVDFFFSSSKEIYLNEVNTFPGFTEVSMYPRMWSSSGLETQDLVARLIEFALERHGQRAKA